MINGRRAEYDMRILGSNLKRLRIKNGFTVEDIRKYLGLGSVQSVYQYENGVALPRADSLLALMELYGIMPAELRNTDCNE